MSLSISRRHVIRGLSLGLSAGLLGAGLAKASQTAAKILVVGGGFGGATAARFLKRYLPAAEISLIEPDNYHTACPFSNLVIADERKIEVQHFGYSGLEAEGISHIRALASDVDSDTKQLTLEDGTKLPYDKLILSPGIDFRWNALEGYDERASRLMPHAWKAGPQTLVLRDKIAAMPDDGLVVISAPPAPFRCPPGPYERASLIGYYLKTHKPRAKLIILDAKDKFSKKPLFLKAWAENYNNNVEWRGESDDGTVRRVDAGTGLVVTDFEEFKADVANIIPPQKAGFIAERAGVTDATGWCPINPIDFSSTLMEDIHIIGDASIATPMPKSAFAANLQAKICALQIARALSGLKAEPTILANTCYSYLNPLEAVSVVGVYSNQDGKLNAVPGAGGLTPIDADIAHRQVEAIQARSWFNTITTEAFT